MNHPETPNFSRHFDVVFFQKSQALLSLTTVFLMWFAHPKFRDSESLATGLVAVGALVREPGRISNRWHILICFLGGDDMGLYGNYINIILCVIFYNYINHIILWD